jgi:hypothetical protein
MLTSTSVLVLPISLLQVAGIVTGYTQVPKEKHDRYRTPPRNYVQLLQHITRARDLPSLAKLVREYGPRFDGVHVAAAMSVLPKLYAAPSPGARLGISELRERRVMPAKLLQHLQVRVCVLLCPVAVAACNSRRSCHPTL